MTSLDRDTWQRGSSFDRKRIAREIQSHLPAGFAHSGIELCALGGKENDIAFFSFDESEFAFIPACTAEIGFECDDWEPSRIEQESWDASEFTSDYLIKDYLEEFTNRPRNVSIPAMLAEIKCFESPWEPVSENHPRVKELLKYEGRSFWTGKMKRRAEPLVRQVVSLPESIDVRVDIDGSVIARRQRHLSIDEARSHFAESGFRLPTNDEWEYLCSGGSRGLFRWGDHAPCNRDPNDPRRLSREDLGPDWDDHRRPNAFGLIFPWNTYDREAVSEGYIRGGDGGGASCGGLCGFVTWSTLASAYFHSDSSIPAGTGNPYAQIRRILDLG